MVRVPRALGGETPPLWRTPTPAAGNETLPRANLSLAVFQKATGAGASAGRTNEGGDGALARLTTEAERGYASRKRII